MMNSGDFLSFISTRVFSIIFLLNSSSLFSILIVVIIMRNCSSSIRRRNRNPIFDKNSISSLKNTHNSIIFNKNHGTFDEQRLNSRQIMYDDFCDCENQTTPCPIIQRNFLSNVSTREMKE
eukprot:GHVR01005487.1.p1 GENE.GHVR01005487.1~~GHVR01005487.1.p1  ORF type:complete len:121 (+),score=3.02 GHVR01005487.1:310-672(+)